MHPELQKYLDGELPRTALAPSAAAELAEWERVERAVVARRRDTAPPGLADAVMRALPDAVPAAASHAATDPAHPLRPAAGAVVPVWQRAWQWLVTPRPMHMPPLAPLAAAAVLALFVLRADRPETAGPPAELLASAPVVYVQFALNAAGATSVTVAGDFNNWSTDAGVLRDADGDGVWTGMVAVTPGVHKYMFVVNGEEWVTDPVAESYVDDGFGMRNALLAVTTPESSS